MQSQIEASKKDKGFTLDGATVRLALGRDSTDGEHRHGGKNAKDHDDNEQLDEGKSLVLLRSFDLILHLGFLPLDW